MLATRRATWRLIGHRPISFAAWVGAELWQCEVPLGWVCDLTSVPWWIPLRKEGPWTPASMVHNVLYARGWLWVEGNMRRALTRRQADRLYLAGMRSLSVPEWKARLLWLGARAGGWRAWRSYRRKNARRLVGHARSFSGVQIAS